MSKDGKTKLGKILLKQQLVDPNELNDLLEEQRTDHQRFQCFREGEEDNRA